MGSRPAHVCASTAGLLVLALCGCGLQSETQDTLEPLDLPSRNPATPDVTVATTTPTAVTAPAPPTTEQRDLPSGDWEGRERFDIGMIHGLTTVGGHPAIEFDRYTYQHPRRGDLDATSLDREPIIYWYTTPPYVNFSPPLRTFVLAPDVEILVLDEASRPDDCEGSAATQPSWRSVGIDHLRTRVALSELATLTYSGDGLVTRIRFTRGC